MAQWNPSPPDPPTNTAPELDDPQLSYDDTIGDTVFSKAWVLSLLVRAVAAVQEGRNGGQRQIPESEGERDPAVTGEETTAVEGEEHGEGSVGVST